MPREPAPSGWAFPPPEQAGPDGLLGVGADLEPGTLLSAYRAGVFPMPLGRSSPVGWWSPDPRGVVPLHALRVSRSLRAATRRFDVRVDTAFAEVLDRCADRRRPGGWITAAMRAAYLRLHGLGWVHSVEAWSPEGGLAGGLYGVSVGGLFAGESMFHVDARWGRDASKVALVALVELLRADGSERLLDVQWCTPHLASLGAVEVSRRDYLRRLRTALTLPAPPAFGGGCCCCGGG